MFVLIPWIFLFLIPAITMRMFAEERKQGTLEFLLTKPLSELQIVLGKFFAAIIIILVALIPTIIYFILVHYFISDHNVDTGAFWGAFVGLFLVASSFAAIGIFASTLTSNQVVAFLVGILISLFMFLGFDLLSQIPFLRPISQIIAYLGIGFHYQSLSKGVLDTRDIIYLLSVIAVFIYASVLIIKQRR
jgi:ABC-2 type transport system permease protein